MIKLFTCFFMLLCWLMPSIAYCQYNNNLSGDTPIVKQPYQQQHLKKEISARWLLVPATMITYGIVSLKNGALQDLNENTKEEIWTEHPHNQLHIDDYLQYAPAVAVYALNIAGIKGKNNLRDRTIICGISGLMVTGVVQAGKKISMEWRPDSSARNSFPSGHTATAFAAAEFMRREYGDVSVWYGIAGYAAAAATGYLRMYNNKHWLGDVIAGAGVGILSTDFAYYIYPHIKKIFSKHSNGATIIMPAYRQGSFQLALLHHF